MIKSTPADSLPLSNNPLSNHDLTPPSARRDSW